MPYYIGKWSRKMLQYTVHGVVGVGERDRVGLRESKISQRRSNLNLVHTPSKIRVSSSCSCFL